MSAKKSDSKSSPKNKWKDFHEELVKKEEVEDEAEAEVESEPEPEPEPELEMTLMGGEEVADHESSEDTGVVGEIVQEDNLAALPPEVLRKKVAALELELQKRSDQLMRQAADMQNLQGRSERDVTKARQFGTERLLQDLVPVMDALLRALGDERPSDEPSAGMYDGLHMTLEILEKTLVSHGMQIVDPAVGDSFDPNLHEAVSMQPAPDAESQTILQVLQRGYALNGRVLQAAMVIVAA